MNDRYEGSVPLTCGSRRLDGQPPPLRDTHCAASVAEMLVLRSISTGSISCGFLVDFVVKQFFAPAPQYLNVACSVVDLFYKFESRGSR